MALLSAERRGDLSEDVYRIKAANSPDASVELAITRLGLADHCAARGVPIVLLHGSFSNRRFWYSPKGIGLGPWLARQGFDVWIAEMRGHGLSPRNLDYPRNRVADYARYDLPVINAFVREQSGCKPHWVGHSLGGTTLAAALGGRYLSDDDVASVALFGSQITRHYWPLKIPPVAWAGRVLLKRFGHFSGSRFKRGPEDEPMGLVIEVTRWYGLFGKFRDRHSDWWAGLADCRVAVMAVAAAGDHQDPTAECRRLFAQIGAHADQHANRFVEVGRQAGFSEDFGHVEMLVSKAAQVEVWPLVAQWVRENEHDLAAPLQAAI